MREAKSLELAKKLVAGCPKGYWIVDDHERQTVYYKNAKSPSDEKSTPYTGEHIRIAHYVFISRADKYHIYLNTHDPVNINPDCYHYTPRPVI